MSKYTTEVRYICENYAGLDESEGQASVNDVISKSIGKVFDFDFPIYDESYRNVLETKILKHYYTREICCETVGLWKHFLDMRMNEIMPYYNQLYNSALINFNPMYDTDYTVKSDRGTKEDESTAGHAVRTDDLHHSDIENAKRTDNLSEAETTASTRTDDLKEVESGNSQRTDNLTQQENGRVERSDNLSHHETVSGNSNSKDKYSDTPQGALTNVENDAYLTNARIISENNSTTTDGTNTGTQTTTSNNTVTNTGTQSNTESKTVSNTGTQRNDGTRNISNTGTQNNDVTKNSTDSGTQKNDTDNTRAFTSTDDYLEHVAGKRGGESYSKMLMEYRETFLNIDMMVIDNLSDLFFNLW